MINENIKYGILTDYDIQGNIGNKLEESNRLTSKNNRENLVMRKRRDRNFFKGVVDGETTILDQEVEARINSVKLDLNSKYFKVKLNAVMEIRKILSIEQNPPINEVIKSGILPLVSDFLDPNVDSQLQFEAAWVITNIASGDSDQTETVVKYDVVPRLVALIKCENEDVQEQCVWALGNISGDSVKFRDIVLNSGALKPLLNAILKGKKLSFIRNSVWTLSNLCRGKPFPNLENSGSILPILSKLIYSEDSDIIADTCWTLSYLSDNSYERIQEIIDFGIVKRICELLSHSNQSIQVPSLRTIGNIVTGDDFQTQVVINCSALSCLLELLISSKKATRREACWTISNITAGSTDQIQSVIDIGIFPVLIEIIKTNELDVKKEAAWAISNATSGGNPQQIKYIADLGVIPIFINFLDCPDERVIKVIMEALENILEVGENKKETLKINPYCKKIEECDGLDKLENLQHHSNDDIYNYSVKILENFFGAEEESSGLPEMNEKDSKLWNHKKQVPDCDFNF